MWLKGIILLFAAYGAVSKDAIVKITRTEITATLPVPGPLQVLEVCYTVDDSTDITTTKLLIARKAEQGEAPPDVIQATLYEHTEDFPVDAHCKYFEGDVPLTHMDKTVTFSLSAHPSPEILVHAEAEFKLPLTFLEKDGATTKQKVGQKTSLRLITATELGEEWSVCNDADPVELNCEGTTCYAIEVGDVSELSFCLQATDASNAVFHSATFEVSDSFDDTFEEGDPSAVLLTYGTPNKLEITSPTISTNLEFVWYNVDNVYAVCINSNPDCELGSYAKNNGDMNILLVDTAASKSSVKTFADYSIEATKLGSGIIEVYWEKPTVHVYFDANIAIKTDAETPVQRVLVDCSRDDPVGPPTICYAYFFGLDPGTEYLVTVAPNKNDDETWLPILTNKIQYEPITADTLDQGISTSSITEITILQNPDHADGVLQVCYRAPENYQNYTRYEAILVDEDGLWIKIYESKQEKNMMNCFLPVNILNTSLSVTKANRLTVVIVERELTGNRVLASGKVDLDISAVRVIKPEVDGGNNGGSSSTLAIVGAAIAGIACLMALVAAAVMFVMKINRNNDGLEYPLQSNNIEDSNIIHGLENPIPSI